MGAPHKDMGVPKLSILINIKSFWTPRSPAWRSPVDLAQTTLQIWATLLLLSAALPEPPWLYNNLNDLLIHLFQHHVSTCSSLFWLSLSSLGKLTPLFVSVTIVIKAEGEAFQWGHSLGEISFHILLCVQDRK